MNSSRLVCCILLVIMMSSPALTQEKPVRIESTHISSSDLPPRFDRERTFVYMYDFVDADSLLAVVTNAGIRILRAWQPLGDQCMGPIGPRFTVELETVDERIFEYGFTKGAVRLHCSPELILFTASN
jgi:hypothetical protein